MWNGIEIYLRIVTSNKDKMVPIVCVYTIGNGSKTNVVNYHQNLLCNNLKIVPSECCLSLRKREKYVENFLIWKISLSMITALHGNLFIVLLIEYHVSVFGREQ